MTVRENSNVTRRGLTTGAVDSRQNPSMQPAPGGYNKDGNYRDRGGNFRYNDGDFRMDHGDIHRTHPRDRGFQPFDRPGHFWGDHPHYYGYRIHYLPSTYRVIHHWGLDYYLYNGIYYRYYGGYYHVCRPPYGTLIERAIDAALFNLVTFSYYSNTYRTYNTVFDNYATIAEQNRIIAENNALIARQNSSYAMNSDRALSSYELANRLGLVQSFAYANAQYYYQDGVFYIFENGQYKVIVPPAGALVSSLPDDYDVIVLDGVEYFQVDQTVYRVTLVDGNPYLEVLGQKYR